jgi:hypothetical protein
MRCRAAILAGALSLFVGVGSAEAKLEILVEKASQRMVVIQDGYMRYIWPVSTGRDQLETPNGTYTPQRMERSWFSSEYYSSPMPYAIFFHNGYAIHGSNAIDRLGGPASHGCVRLHPHHAALLFDLVQQEGPQNTTIEVTDEPAIDGPPSRESEQARAIPAALPRSDAIPRPPEAMPREAMPRQEFGPRQEVMPRPPEAMQRPPQPMAGPPEALSRPPEALPRPVTLPRGERPAEFRDMAEFTASPRPVRPVIARPPPPRIAPPERRQVTSLIDSIAPPRAPRLKPAEPPLRTHIESARAESPPPAQMTTSAPRPVQAAQPAPGGLKVLPASCWSGGASRWRWWQSGSGPDTPCK